MKKTIEERLAAIIIQLEDMGRRLNTLEEGWRPYGPGTTEQSVLLSNGSKVNFSLLEEELRGVCSSEYFMHCEEANEEKND